MKHGYTINEEVYDAISCTTKQPYNIVMGYSRKYSNIFSPFAVEKPSYAYRGNIDYRDNTLNMPYRTIHGNITTEPYHLDLNATSDNDGKTRTMVLAGSFDGTAPSNTYANTGLYVGTINYYSNVGAAVIVSGVKDPSVSYVLAIKGLNGTSETSINGTNSFLELESGIFEENATCLNKEDGVYMVAANSNISAMGMYCQDESKFPITNAYCSAPMLCLPPSVSIKVIDSALAVSEIPTTTTGKYIVKTSAPIEVKAGKTAEITNLVCTTPEGLSFTKYPLRHIVGISPKTHSFTVYGTCTNHEAPVDIEIANLNSRYNSTHSWPGGRSSDTLKRDRIYDGNNNLVDYLIYTTPTIENKSTVDVKISIEIEVEVT